MNEQGSTTHQRLIYKQKRKELIKNVLDDKRDYYSGEGISKLSRSDLMLLYISLYSQQEGGTPGLEIKDETLREKIQALGEKMRRLNVNVDQEVLNAHELMAELEGQAQEQSGQVEEHSEVLASIKQQKAHYQKKQKESTDSSAFVDWLRMPYSPYYGPYYYRHDPLLSAWMISDIFNHGRHRHGGFGGHRHGGHSDGCCVTCGGCDGKGDGCGEVVLVMLAIAVILIIITALAGMFYYLGKAWESDKVKFALMVITGIAVAVGYTLAILNTGAIASLTGTLLSYVAEHSISLSAAAATGWSGFFLVSIGVVGAVLAVLATYYVYSNSCLNESSCGHARNWSTLFNSGNPRGKPTTSPDEEDLPYSYQQR